MGLFADLPFAVEHIRLNPGDTLLAFTDGSADARNSAGMQFSEERLLESIQQPWSSAFSLLYDLNAGLTRHIGGQNQYDDITQIALRRRLASGPDRHAI